MLVKFKHADGDKKHSILKLNKNGLVIAVEVYLENSVKPATVTSYPQGIDKKLLPIDSMNVTASKTVVVKKIIREEMVEEEITEPVNKDEGDKVTPESNEPTPAEPEQPKSKKGKIKDGGN